MGARQTLLGYTGPTNMAFKIRSFQVTQTGFYLVTLFGFQLRWDYRPGHCPVFISWPRDVTKDVGRSAHTFLDREKV